MTRQGRQQPTLGRQDRRVFVFHYAGELSIKAKGTRNRFAERLARNLADALGSADVPHRIRRTWARLYVESPSARVAEIGTRVFGFQAVSVAERRPWRSLEDILQAGTEIFAEEVNGKTFAVRVRRGGRRRTMPFTSPEVERRLGSLLSPLAAGVDLKSPQVEARVELRRGDAYYSSTLIPASGGLPLGTEGRALALVSGGFDSAVAAWLMMRRGVMLDYLFCNLGGDAHRDSVLAVIKTLADVWSAGYRPQLHMIDFQPVVEELEARCPRPLRQVLLKRQMLRAADSVARMGKAAAIVTGDAVGQVSSQTLQNMAVISSATEIPILRPLVAASKDEIVATARRIGTHDLSALVRERCMLVSRHPETHAKPQQVAKAELDLQGEKLKSLIEERAVFDLRALDLSKARAPQLEMDSVPEGATVIDLRSPLAFRSWHYPKALQLGYTEALAAHRSFDRDQTYLFYCEVGLKSAHLAELMDRAGYRAYHFRGGLKPLMRYANLREAELWAASSPALLNR